MKSIRRSAKLESLEGFMQFVVTSARDAGFPARRVQETEIAVEEALVNIINYAYPEQDNGDVEVKCGLDNQGRLLIEIRDKGIPFDVGSHSDPDLNVNIAERKIGGLGIFFIRKMADKVHYRRDGEENVLTLVITRPEA
jgi:serine/threonine-protein kinase RsbW